MSNISLDVITAHLEAMVKDFQCDVVDACAKILSSEEIRRLDDIVDDDRKIEEFLNLLSFKPIEDLSVFFKYLEEHYSWIYSSIQKYMVELNKENPLLCIQKLGGIPNLPPKNVTRKQLVDDLRKKLRSLKSSYFLVVHGMVGCGKTSLAVEALHDYELLKEHFGEKVYWLTVGPDGSEDPSFLLAELNARLPSPVQNLSSRINQATIQLIKAFINNGWTDCLIVLDDVIDEAILDVFNVGAKTLVITRDASIIKENKRSKCDFIKVNEGFTLEETNELFSMALNTDNKAKLISEIHKYSKGLPFLLSLIVSQLAEFREDVENDKRWEYLINSFFFKGDKRRSMTEVELYFKPLESLVKSLRPEEQECFQKLAVFQEDVNIRSEVLGTLWSVDKFKAELIMVRFVHKSLAVRKFISIELQSSYIYGVHDLICDFLKKDLSPEDEKALHSKFISEYQKICGNDWSMLPKDDNYIFYYIGYHLKKAGMNETIKKIYFDLEFLEAKLRVTGPADLIRDLRKYRDIITGGDPELLEKLNEFSSFIEDFGVWISQRPGVDIIQAALQTPVDSYVRKAAVELARKSEVQQKYTICSSTKKKIVPETLFLKTQPTGKINLTALCFGRTVNEAIVGFENGTIELYNLKTKSIIKTFNEHKNKIVCLDLASDKSQFLSVALDNTVRVWSLSHSDGNSGDRTPPARQEGFIDLFVDGSSGEASKHVLTHEEPLTLAHFSKNSEMIGTLTTSGVILVWKNGGEVMWESRLKSFAAMDFCTKDEFIIAANKNTKMIHMLYSKSGLQSNTKEIPQFEDLISIRTIVLGDVEKLVILRQSGVTVFDWTPNKVAERQEGSQFNNPMDLPLRSPISRFCGVGSLIGIVTQDNSLFVYNSLNGANITHLPFEKNVVCFCVGESAILGGDSERKVMLYPVDALSSPFTRLKWSPGCQPVLATVDTTHTNVHVFIGEEKVWSVESEGVEKIDVADDGTALVTCSNTQVRFHKDDFSQEITTDLPSSVFLLGSSSPFRVLLYYQNGDARIWEEEKSEFKYLCRFADCRNILEYAALFKFPSKQCIVAAPPFSMWTDDGQCLVKHCISLKSCVSETGHLLAVVTTGGVSLNRFEESGARTEIAIKDTTRQIRHMAFSPNGNMLALIDRDGSYKVLDIAKDKIVNFNDNVAQKSCHLAVSDNGTICFSGDGLLVIITKDDVMTSAVLDAATILPDPSGSDRFAVTDKTGHLHVVCQGEV